MHDVLDVDGALEVAQPCVGDLDAVRAVDEVGEPEIVPDRVLLPDAGPDAKHGRVYGLHITAVGLDAYGQCFVRRVVQGVGVRIRTTCIVERDVDEAREVRTDTAPYPEQSVHETLAHGELSGHGPVGRFVAVGRDDVPDQALLRCCELCAPSLIAFIGQGRHPPYRAIVVELRGGPANDLSIDGRSVHRDVNIVAR